MAMSTKRVYGELGTLYAKCGGVFGVSAFVDKCMDKWMADSLLNNNAAVATWHETAQRPGFKFLVVQIVCNLTGGPQIYTGRPMDEAHKHLNISENEWEKFMELFNAVCDEFSLPGDIVGDLNALMISMEMDCVVYPGETAPPNPGRAVPKGNSLYARLGGVYPIALLADRLVDALLADDRLQIPMDEKRTDASLKYLFTELICSITGGPEVRTAGNDSNETKLLIPRLQFPVLINTVTVAGDHLPRNLLPELVQVLQRSRDAIIDPSSPQQIVSSAPLNFQAATVKDMCAAAAGENLNTSANARRAVGASISVAARRRVHGDPRTLYGRGGGVFGLAKLSDRLMDVWMENQLLNANQSVAKWHESQQKFGFKFLVTQLLGYLTGGPQRYTGQSMEAAHKHLGISAAEWNSFVADADRVFREFNIEQSVHNELLAIVQSFKDQCTVRQGEQVPSDPGLCRQRPHGSTPYAHLGGIYPIALFVDRLVEAVLRGPKALQVGWDANGTRTPAALKFIVTEVLANATGGPELVTAGDFEEAKLGIEVGQWDEFLALANEAASVWPTPHHRSLMITAITAKQASFCKGLVDESGISDARRQLFEEFGVIEQAAALDTCNGDAAAALALLRGGWTPHVRQANMNSAASVASLDTDMLSVHEVAQPPSPAQGHACPVSGAMSTSTSGCPFMGARQPAPPPPPSAAAPPQPPAAAGSSVDEELKITIQVLTECGKSKQEISQMLSVDESMIDLALSLDRYAVAAKCLAHKRISFADISQTLNMSEARVHGAVLGRGAGQSAVGIRLLGNTLQTRLDELCEEDSELCCPVTLMLFQNPVIASDGFMYEVESIKTLIRNHQASPITRERLKQEYFPAKQRKSEVYSFREKRSKALLAFAKDAISTEPRMSQVALDRVVEYLEVLKPAQYPSIAQEAATIWAQTGRPLPRLLQA
eukprot:TRINITY_DN716_c0_g1_i1.p1 TRINITY_DN716_c0_g1~~TRINITY_DN716_c0_g1_i1.p1  ORF type:complete len:961 (+),score=185.41 TRINITY_DN716_c0_g1_i1:56-2884(+)